MTSDETIVSSWLPSLQALASSRLARPLQLGTVMPEMYIFLLVTVLEREPCPRWYCKDVTSVPDFLVEFLLPLRLWVLPLQQQLKPQEKPGVFFRWSFWTWIAIWIELSYFWAGKKPGILYDIFDILSEILLEWVTQYLFFYQDVEKNSGCDPEPCWTTDTSQRRIVWP